MWVTRGVSVTNFVIASSALGFQVFVLYPWHHQLSEDIEAAKREQLRAQEATEARRATAMRELRDELLEMKLWQRARDAELAARK